MTEPDHYLYSDGKTLKNKLEIHNPEILKRAEDEIATYRQEDALQIALSAHVICLDTYKAIHQCLLSDLYPWAGKTRTCDLAKQSTMFCKPEFIESQAKQIFQNLQENNYYAGLPVTEYADKLACAYGDVNMLHPFREGNGRSQKILFQGIAAKVGYRICWERISKAEHIEAIISEQRGKPQLLIELLIKALEKI